MLRPPSYRPEEDKESNSDKDSTTPSQVHHKTLPEDRQVEDIMHGKECDGEKSVTKNITAPQVHNGVLRETGQMENRMHGRENDSDVGRCVTEIITPLQVHNGVLREDGQEEGEEDKLRMLSDASNHKQRDEGSESESSPTKPKEEGDNATQDPQPPDGGWGWAVVFGASLISAAVPTLAPSFGVLFAPQLLQWGASSTTVAVLFNAFMVAWKAAGVVAPTLTSELGFRRVAITGTLLTACCLVASAFATSAVYLFISFSLGCGVGCGLSCVGFLIVSHYFKRRRGLAHAFHTSGIGVGRFLSPLLIHLLQDTYGHRGATLLMGGVVLHAFLGATLYHPVRWHVAPRPPPPRQHQAPLLPSAPPPGHSVRVVSRSRSLSEGNTGVGVELRPCHQSFHSLAYCRTSRLSVASLDQATMASVASLDTLASTIATEPGHEAPQTRRSGSVLYRLWQTVTRIGAALLRDLAILRRPLALTIAFSAMFVFSAQLNFTVLLPFAMQAAGYPLHTAAWCLSLIGVTNLFFRMLSATLSDYAWFNMRLCCLLALATMAAAATIFPFQTSVAGTAVVIGMWGVSLGVYQGLSNLYMVRLVGVHNLAPMLGSRNLMVAFGFTTVGPLLGVVRDASGSYAVSCWVVAGLIAVSFILWLLMPAAVAYDKRRKEKEEKQAVSLSV